MAEVENIVAQTAERIFADLADAQTVNRDKNGGWKASLGERCRSRPAIIVGR